MNKISVIIPTYNRANTLPMAIQSVLNQTFKDLEIIIVNDGSTDNTEEVIKKIEDKRIYYIRHEKNKGVSAARNTGIKASSGEFIAFLDDDDEWFPEKLEYQIDVFKKNPDVGLVYTGIWEIGKEEQKISYTAPRKRGYLYHNFLFPDNIPLQILTTPLVKRECFEKVGLFDENLRGHNDRDMWLRISEYYEFEFVQRPLLKYRIHGDNRISNDLELQIEEWGKFYKKHSVRFDSKPRMKKKFYSQCHYKRAIIFYLKGSIIDSTKEFIKAITLDPLNFTYYHTPFAHLLKKIINTIALGCGIDHLAKFPKNIKRR